MCDVLTELVSEAGAIILKMVYDYNIEPFQPDPLIDIIDEAMLHFASAVAAGSWLVDIIPWLKYIPGWMPGAGWKKIGKKWRATLKEVTEKPLLFAQQRIANGHSGKSFVSDFHKNRSGTISPVDSHALKWVAVSNL